MKRFLVENHKKTLGFISILFERIKEIIAYGVGVSESFLSDFFVKFFTSCDINCNKRVLSLTHTLIPECMYNILHAWLVYKYTTPRRDSGALKLD
jgi:hypothetical protein